MKCTISNGKVKLFSMTIKDCLIVSIVRATEDIERMEQKIKDLDFAVYLRTGKFPE